MGEKAVVSEKMELREVLWRLRESAGRYLNEAAQQIAFGNSSAAVAPLSYAVSFRFHENLLRNTRSSASQLVRLTVDEVDREVHDLSELQTEKVIIHSNSPDAAYNLLNTYQRPTEQRRLFWLGYFFAEHWANSDALKVFSRLVQETAEARVLHWTGNLFAKLGCFETALPFLEKARQLEPGRYNHQSHLGNVYRGLHRRAEAEACYRSAIALIEQHEIGRVEHIHLVRCYQGLSELGHPEYRAERERQKEAALASGEVREEELHRIMF